MGHQSNGGSQLRIRIAFVVALPRPLPVVHFRSTTLSITSHAYRPNSRPLHYPRSHVTFNPSDRALRFLCSRPCLNSSQTFVELHLDDVTSPRSSEWAQRRLYASPTSAAHDPKASCEALEAVEVVSRPVAPPTSRRRALIGAAGALAASLAQLPFAIASTVDTAPAKRLHVPIEELKDIIATDIAEREYIVTGKLSRDLYNEKCRFKDPTTDVYGLQKYLNAVNILFDPAHSKFELLSIDITSPTTILASWRLQGYLQFPWHPYVRPYEGTTTYTIDDDGLIASHIETWEISPVTALLWSVVPTAGPQD